jgi:hypothetical protein
MRLVDLTGRRFAQLTVLSRGETRKTVIYWTCLCDCGRTIEAHGGDLKRGKRTSCGHVDSELAAGRRPWPVDPRYLVGEDGSIVGPSGKIIKPQVCDGGYLKILTSRNNRPWWRPVHVMVCETYHGPRPEGMQAAHNNGIPAECGVENVRWATPLENAADRKLHGTHTQGETHPPAKLTEQAVREIRRSNQSCSALAVRYGVATSTVDAARRGTTWRHVA